MMQYLQDLFKQRKDIEKYYIAIVHWIVKNKNFTIESYIGRDPNNRLKMTTINPLNPKIALSHWEVLGYIENKFSLVKIKLETGRTHQIRVHLASIGHFILWDSTYWNFKINTEIKTKYQLKRQALHAYNLKLKLYWKDMDFKAELKDDMKKLIPEELMKLI
jgi:23S rRNA pseudouridine1911/1915/1917 synthase